MLENIVPFLLDKKHRGCEDNYELHSKILDLQIKNKIEKEKREENPYYPYEILKYDWVKEKYPYIIRIGRLLHENYKGGLECSYCFWVKINNEECKFNIDEKDFLNALDLAEDIYCLKMGIEKPKRVKPINRMSDREILIEILENLREKKEILNGGKL